MLQTKNSSIRIIEYGGKKVYYLNHACLTGNDLIEDIEECERALFGMNDILVLENFENTSIVDNYDRFFDETTIQYRKGWKKVAIIGEKDILPIFSDITKLSACIDAEVFTNRIQALEYLVS